MSYQPVIGLEIHIQLKTKSKMFCSCSADIWGVEPNTATCPVCLGLPGALPTINQLAVQQVVKVAQALNCKINNDSFFERKNYFYPDLPKGFQISQHRRPIGIDGFLLLENGKKIRISDVHLEEDTAKSLHEALGTLLDFNKSGVPLMEIVSAPDLSSADEALEYGKKIYQLVRWLNVSGADMEKGQLRLELNISLKTSDSALLPDYKVEVKNINSFRFLKQAIVYEIKRQSEILEKGQTVSQENRGFNDAKGVTLAQREKEEAFDYRYFPEPDLPPLAIEVQPLTEILPNQALSKLVSEYGLSKELAQQITREKNVYLFFEDLINEELPARQAANLILNKPELTQLKPKQLVARLLEKQKETIQSAETLKPAIEKVLIEHQKVVQDYKNGKVEALKFLIGQVMKQTQGKADPQLTAQLLKERLA